MYVCTYVCMYEHIYIYIYIHIYIHTYIHTQTLHAKYIHIRAHSHALIQQAPIRLFAWNILDFTFLHTVRIHASSENKTVVVHSRFLMEFSTTKGALVSDCE